MSKFKTLLVSGLSLLTLATVMAQETSQRKNQTDRDRDQPGRTEVRVSGQQGKSSAQLDKFFVSCLKAENEAEITIAKLATQKATNPEVKSFAQQMVKDHSDFVAKLSRFDQETAGLRSGSSTTIRAETRQPSATDRPGTDQPEATKRDATRSDAANQDKTKPRTDRRDNAATTNTTNPPNARAGVQVDVNRTDVATQTTAGGGDITNQLIAIKQEITNKCVASAQRELGMKEGREFDQCYMFMQVGAHMKMVDELSVLNRHASPELQQVLDEGLQTAQQHLEHAKQLAKKIDQSSQTASDGRATEKSDAAPAKTARKKQDNP